MFVFGVGKNGATVDGDGGRVFIPTNGDESIRVKIAISVRSDKVSREVWMPPGKTVEVKLDTGADTTCLSSKWMLRLGLKEDEADAVVPVTVANGEIVDARRKYARFRVSGFAEPIVVPICYSPKFREDLFVLSLAALANYFGIALSAEKCVLFEY